MAIGQRFKKRKGVPARLTGARWCLVVPAGAWCGVVVHGWRWEGARGEAKRLPHSFETLGAYLSLMEPAGACWSLLSAWCGVVVHGG